VFTKFFRDLLFRREIDQIIVDRRGSYTLTIKRNEELPLEIWAYIVKRRANFRCEDCGSTENISAHHIKRPEDGGKNILSNGRCLCSECHPRYRIYPKKREERRNKTKWKLIDSFGFTKGNEIFERYEKCKTRKERHQLIDDISKEDSQGFIKWIS